MNQHRSDFFSDLLFNGHHMTGRRNFPEVLN